MSEPLAAPQQPPEQPPDGSVSGLQSFYERAGGLLVPLAATFLAFLVGGIVVLITEKSVSAPFEAYKAIFEGTGLTWFIPGATWSPAKMNSAAPPASTNSMNTRCALRR